MWCEKHDKKWLKRARSKGTRNAELPVNVQPAAPILFIYHVTHSMWIAAQAQIINRATS